MAESCSITTASVTEGINDFILEKSIGKGFTYGDNDVTLRVTNLREAQLTASRVNNQLGGRVLHPSSNFPNNVYNIAISDQLVKAHVRQLQLQEVNTDNPRDVNYFDGDQALFEQEEKGYLQSALIPSSANDVTVAKLEDWLKGMGVNPEKVEAINGSEKIKGRAMIDGSGALVQYVGDPNTVLPEEALHIAVEILEQTNPTLFNKMLNKIGNYNIYSEVYKKYSEHKQYQKDGKPDIRKLKKEAIGKLLVEMFILENEDTTEKPENLQYTQSWWDDVVEFFGEIFFGENYNPFKIAASNITNLTAEDLQATIANATGEEFLQLTDEQRAGQDAIAAKFDQKLVDYQVTKVTGKSEFEDQDDINFYQRLKAGKLGQVAKRVTDFVKDTKTPEILAKFENAIAEKKREYKQKAEWGTKFHADAEHIIKAALDSTGRLKKHSEISFAGITPELGANGFAALSNYLVGTEQVPGILYAQFPQGTLFRTEQMLYDETRDVAGTLDLIGITPQQKIRVFDWKTKFLNLTKDDDVPWYSQGDYRVQLNQYNVMLNRAYGIKKEDLEVAQAMPILFSGTVAKNGDVGNVKLTLPSINYKEEKRRYLLPVPVESQSSGNKQLDEYVRALNALHQILLGQKVENKELKNEQLNAISGAIRELQIKQNFGPLAEQGQVFIKGTENSLNDLKETFKDENGQFRDFNSFPKEAIDTMLNTLKLQDENIHKYTNMYVVFSDIYGEENLTKEQKEIMKALEALSLQSRKFEVKLKEERKAYVAWVAENTTGIKGLLNAEKPIRFIVDRTISEISKIQTKGLNVLRNLTSRAKNDSRLKFNREAAKFEKILDAFEKFASGQGLGVRDYFSTITEKNAKGQPTNKLVRQYKKQFFDEYDAAVTEGKIDVAWLQKNIDLEEFEKYAEERYTSIAIDISKTIYPHKDEADLMKKRQEKAKEALARFDISTPDSLGWYHPSMRSFPKSEWVNPEYTRIQGIPALADMYNFITNLNEYAKDVGYHDSNYQFTKAFLPWMKASTVDNIRTSGISSAFDSLQDFYKLTPEEEISYVKTNPNTGEIERSIPAYFTKGDFAKNEEGEYDLSKISTDLGKTITHYMAAVYEYESLSNIETLAKSVLDIEKGKQALQIDDRGNIIRHEGTTDPKLTENTENASLYESFMDAIIYKKQDIGVAGLSPEGTKLVDKANMYFRLKVFALNIISPATIFFGGNLQGLINSNKLWRKREWISNEMKVVTSAFSGKDGNIEKGLIDYFLPLTENTTWEKAKRMSLDRLQRWSFAEIIMSPIRKADRTIQLTTALTMLNNTIIDENGNLVNARVYVEESPEFRKRYKLPEAERIAMESRFEEMVAEAIEKNGLKKKVKFDADGFLEIEGVDRMSETVYKTRLAILNEIKAITGAMSEEDRRDGDRSVIFRSFTMFKNWIPTQTAIRIQELKYNPDINRYEMGRMRMVYQIIKNGDGKFIKGAVQGIKDLIDMQMGNERGVKLLEEYYRRTAEAYKKATDKDLEMTPEQFYDMTRKAIAQQAKETVTVLSLFAMVLAYMGLSPDKDDDKETKNLYKTGARLLDKLVDEVSFYYNPLSIQQILGGTMFPSIGILTDGWKLVTSLLKETGGRVFGVEDWEKNAHPTKNFLKTIPMANQFFSVYVPLLAPETSQDLGFVVTAESRR